MSANSQGKPGTRVAVLASIAAGAVLAVGVVYFTSPEMFSGNRGALPAGGDPVPAISDEFRRRLADFAGEADSAARLLTMAPGVAEWRQKMVLLRDRLSRIPDPPPGASGADEAVKWAKTIIEVLDSQGEVIAREATGPSLVAEAESRAATRADAEKLRVLLRQFREGREKAAAGVKAKLKEVRRLGGIP